MSKEQTQLERIKDEVAKEAYCLDWNHLVHKYPSSKDTKYWPIVIERYTRECCQATLEKAAGSGFEIDYNRCEAAYICVNQDKTKNCGCYMGRVHKIKSSITNKDNIVIL